MSILIVAIGEILFDVFASYRRLGGAPFNFAFHLDRFGRQVRFVSRIGEDAPGRDVLNILGQRQFDASFIQIDPRHPTGEVRIELDREGVPAFDIQKEVAYDHLAFDPGVFQAHSGPFELLYFGTLLQRTPGGFETLQRYLQRKPPDTRCFYDINLRPRCFHEAAVSASLHHTDVLKLNIEELETVKRMLGIRYGNRDSLRWLMDDFDIGMIALTQGAEGSELHTPSEYYRETPGRGDAVVDTVGAGDAYAAVLALGYLRRWHPQRIIADATRFAARICGMEGAIPSRMEDYRDFLKEMGNRNG
jgi:fructokinase